MAKYQGFRITALYERLSRDDENQGESNSILNQKKYLEDYARKNGFTNIRHFTDDGYTGRNFSRPGFQEMLAEVEAGNVETVIVKDMSRFGRNYLQVGFYSEVLFPQKNVRFLAINNSVDSSDPLGNDFAPFLNIMNEWYAKDTSKKIHAIFDSRMSEGKRCSGSIPYGYNRLPGDKQKLVVDPVASEVVRRIFNLAAEGKSLSEIGRILSADKILIPSAYTAKYHPEQSNHRTNTENCNWSSTTIGYILDRKEYLGHTVLRKSICTNFKTNTRRDATESEMLVFENTHEPIVTQNVWDVAQKMRVRAPMSVAKGTYSNSHVLSGMVFCADCGGRMTFGANYDKNDRSIIKYHLRCCNYKGGNKSCTGHYISAKPIETLLLESITRLSRYVIQNEEEFANQLRDRYEAKKNAIPMQNKKEQISAQKRIEELDSLIQGLYENFVSGILPERQYKSLMNKYDTEQAELEKKLQVLQSNIEASAEKPMQIERFISLIKKYKEPKELTPELVHDLIDKIVIHEAEGQKKNRTQQIDIYYSFIGEFNLAYSNAELKEIEKIEKAEQKKKEKLKAEKKKKTNKKNKERESKKRQEKKEARLLENDGHMYPQKSCKVCGKMFWPTTSHNIYCSKECHQESIRLKKEMKRADKEGHKFNKRTCVLCGKEFWPKNGSEVLCSEECKVKNRRQKQYVYYHEKAGPKEKERRKIENETARAENDGHLLPKKICEYCGNEFWPVRSSQKYCSKKCSDDMFESKRLDRDVAEKEGHKFFKKVCTECGKEFWPRGSNDLCCSEECRNKKDTDIRNAKYQKVREARIEANGGHPFEQRICADCGKEYWPTSFTQKYCCEECNIHANQLHKLGREPSEKEGHPYFKRVCVVCGEEFWPNGPNTKTCSAECRKANDKKHIEDFHKRIQEGNESENKTKILALNIPALLDPVKMDNTID